MTIDGTTNAKKTLLEEQHDNRAKFVASLSAAELKTFLAEEAKDIAASAAVLTMHTEYHGCPQMPWEPLTGILTTTNEQGDTLVDLDANANLYAFKVRNALEDDCPDIQYLADLTDAAYRIALVWDSLAYGDGDDLVILFKSQHEPAATLDPLMERLTGVVALKGSPIERRDVLLDFSQNVSLANEDADTQPQAEETPQPTKLPGIAGELIDATIATARKAQPQLSIGSTMALMSGILGRKVKLEGDTHPNIYIIALSASGSGKDHPSKVIQKVLQAVGADNVVGPSNINSGAGIVSKLNTAGCESQVMVIDEIAGLFREIFRTGAASHNATISSLLLSLWSAADSANWKASCYADADRNAEIVHPHLTVYGNTTMVDIFKAMNTDALENGLLARLCFFQGDADAKPQRHKKEFQIPESVTNWGRAWTAYKAQNQSTGLHQCKRVEMSQEADDARWAEVLRIEDLRKEQEPHEMATYNRVIEIAQKFALIIECGQHMPTDDFEISLDSWNAGLALSLRNAKLVTSNAGKVGATQFESDQDGVLEFIRSAGSNGGVTMRAISRRFKRLKKRERDEIVTSLQEQERIELVKVGTGARPKIIVRAL